MLGVPPFGGAGRGGGARPISSRQQIQSSVSSVDKEQLNLLPQDDSAVLLASLEAREPSPPRMK